MPKSFGRDTNIGVPYPPDKEIADTFSNRLNAVIALVDAVEPTQVSIREAQELIKTFVDGVEPTQLAMQETQAALQAAQAVIQEAQATIQAAQAITHGKVDMTRAEVEVSKWELKDRMDASLLPLAEDETVETPNPIVLFELPQVIYQCTSLEPFHFPGGCVELFSGSWDKQEEVAIFAEAMVEGHWEEVYRYVLGKKTYIPLKGMVYLAGFDCSGGGVRVGMEQSEEGDGFHTWNHSFVQ